MLLRTKAALQAASMTSQLGFRHRAMTSQAGAVSHYKFVVAGGGAGGCAAAANLAKLGSTAVIDPAHTHYYQPMWTLVGAGSKTTAQSARPQATCIPKKATWYQARVEGLDPDNSTVTMDDKEQITYEYLVLALGLDIRFDKVRGLAESLGTQGVCSNYGAGNADYTWSCLSSLGPASNLIFTFPDAPIKCAGAPQKIMYLAEAHLRRAGIRDTCSVEYHTPGPSIFGIPKYAAALAGLAAAKGCEVLTRSSLVEVRGGEKVAVFKDLDTGDLSTRNFDMLHVGPPCAPLPVYAESPLADNAGWVDVDKHTLQHNTYSNVFAIGDCNSCPTGKTAAKVAGESGVLLQNLKHLVSGGGGPLPAKYNGYTSCPLTVGDNKLILAEFGYDGEILETLPVNQARPSRVGYWLKREVMPPLYWHGLVRGWWRGPGVVRKVLHLGMEG